jgi:hypothetical protein
MDLLPSVEYACMFLKEIPITETKMTCR